MWPFFQDRRLLWLWRFFHVTTLMIVDFHDHGFFHPTAFLFLHTWVPIIVALPTTAGLPTIVVFPTIVALFMIVDPLMVETFVTIVVFHNRGLLFYQGPPDVHCFPYDCGSIYYCGFTGWLRFALPSITGPHNRGSSHILVVTGLFIVRFLHSIKSNITS